MRTPITALLLCLAVLLLGGCVTAERLDQLTAIATRAEAIAQKAADGLASAEKAVEVANRALQTAQTVAEATQSDQALRAVEAGRKALAEAEAALPVARAAVDTTRETAELAKATVAEAKAQQEAGASGWETALTLALGLLAGGGGVAARLVPAIRQWRAATTLTAAHAERMEKAETDDDVAEAKHQARLEQSLAGVATLIAAARGKG